VYTPPTHSLQRRALLLSLLLGGTAKAVATPLPAALERPALPLRRPASTALLGAALAGSRLVAVGARGAVLLSDDHAASWRQVTAPVSVTLTGVQFVDAQHGWAIGHAGVVLATQDGGQTWRKQLDGRQIGQLALEAARAKQGRAGETNSELADAQRLAGESADKPLLALHFSDPRNGWVIGAYNLILRTRDGGQSWLPWMGHVDNPQGMHLYAITAHGGNLYLAGEQGQLWRSRDNGEHFERLTSPYKGSFFVIQSNTDGTLLVAGLRGHVFRSADAGTSWQTSETPEGPNIGAATTLPDGRWLLANQAGQIWLSDDQGQHFRASKQVAPPMVNALLPLPDGRLLVAGLQGLNLLSKP
jgi:photosystem II stability/assembly factor-like uncharacterized protein